MSSRGERSGVPMNHSPDHSTTSPMVTPRSSVSPVSRSPAAAAVSQSKTPPHAQHSTRATPRNSNENSVGVVVRVRPLSTLEHADPSLRSCVQCLRDCVVVGGGSTPSGKVSVLQGGSAYKVTRAQQFRVDQVFHPHTSQIEVYEQSCRHVVEGVFHGMNGSILAYGATGSGKTHTMFGGAMSAAGIAYQAVQDIFAEKCRLEEEEGKSVKVKCSFVEIYNEDVFDLLVAPPSASSPHHPRSPTSTSAPSDRTVMKRRLSMSSTQLLQRRVPLQVREVSRDVIARTTNPERLTICGLTHAYPESVEEFARYIEVGHANRFVATTGANAHSSRSHAIITVEVQVREGSSSSSVGGSSMGTVARIRFCDLAGSERAASTSNTGVRLREGGNINRSLLALGAVVQSLVQRKRSPAKDIFVPYRGSKLTRLLRDGIGGNCQTQMLFCLSPSSKQYEESMNTMQFAMQAKEIHVSATRNEYSVSSKQVAQNQEAVIEELRSEVAALREELVRQGGSSSIMHMAMPHAQSSHWDTLSRKSSVGVPSSTAATVPSPPQQGGSSFSRARSASTVSAVEDRSTRLTLEIPDSAQAGGSGSIPSPRAQATSSPTWSSVGAASASPAPVNNSSVTIAPLSSTLLESESAVWSPADTNKTTGTRPPSCSRAQSRSVFTEGSAMFTELESKLKSFSVEKEALYHQLRVAQEQQSDRDIQLREQKWRLARFLANNAMNNTRSRSGSSSESNNNNSHLTPVGVAGLRQLIAVMEKDNETQDEVIDELTWQMDRLDRRIAATRQELLKEKQQASLELLLDNAKLRQSCTEAECLAAHYHQKCRVNLNREQEYEQALSTCVTAIRGTLSFLPFSSHQHEQCKMALVFADLPKAETSSLLTVFENSLKAGATPPLAPPHPSMASSPSAAAAQAASSPSGAVAPDGDDLQQHYRELVEAASCFRALSPVGGRGRRHAPHVEDPEAPPMIERTPPPKLLMHKATDGAADAESTPAAPEQPAAAGSSSPPPEDKQRSPKSPTKKAAVSVEAPKEQPKPSRAVKAAFSRSYSTASLIEKSAKRPTTKKKAAAAATPTVVVSGKAEPADPVSPSPPGTPIDDAHHQQQHMLAVAETRKSKSPMSALAAGVPLATLSDSVLNTASASPTKRLHFEESNLMLANSNSSSHNNRASPPRRRLVVENPFRRTKTDSALLPSKPSVTNATTSHSQRSSRYIVRTNASAELRAVQHPPAVTKGNILISNNKNKFTRTASDPGRYLARDVSPSSKYSSARNGNTNANASSSNNNNNSNSIRAVPKQQRKSRGSPEDEQHSLDGNAVVLTSSPGSCGSDHSSPNSTPASTSRVITKTHNNNNNNHNGVKSGSAAPVFKKRKAAVASSNSLALARRKAVKQRSVLSVDSINHNGSNGPLRRDASSLLATVSPADSLVDLILSKDSGRCADDALSLSADDELMVSQTTCSELGTPF